MLFTYTNVKRIESLKFINGNYMIYVSKGLLGIAIKDILYTCELESFKDFKNMVNNLKLDNNYNLACKLFETLRN